jgi:hypothetical protein
MKVIILLAKLLLLSLQYNYVITVRLLLPAPFQRFRSNVSLFISKTGAPDVLRAMGHQCELVISLCEVQNNDVILRPH